MLEEPGTPKMSPSAGGLQRCSKQPQAAAAPPPAAARAEEMTPPAAASAASPQEAGRTSTRPARACEVLGLCSKASASCPRARAVARLCAPSGDMPASERTRGTVLGGEGSPRPACKRARLCASSGEVPASLSSRCTVLGEGSVKPAWEVCEQPVAAAEEAVSAAAGAVARTDTAADWVAEPVAEEWDGGREVGAAADGSWRCAAGSNFCRLRSRVCRGGVFGRVGAGRWPPARCTEPGRPPLRSTGVAAEPSGARLSGIGLATSTQPGGTPTGSVARDRQE
mmetsp:Transcript_100523/g.260144  ORF Transcript_100523/g.260144 Transcript_100523/m.260144 type:complete len:282 (+) Transcript_100523:2061-2906(+)